MAQITLDSSEKPPVQAVAEAPPVVVLGTAQHLGFTNAAAIIIATSQLDKIFGVGVEKAEHHYETVARVVASALDWTHLPTLGMAVLAFTAWWAGRHRLAQLVRRPDRATRATVLAA